MMPEPSAAQLPCLPMQTAPVLPLGDTWASREKIPESPPSSLPVPLWAGGALSPDPGLAGGSANTADTPLPHWGHGLSPSEQISPYNRRESSNSPHGSPANPEHIAPCAARPPAPLPAPNRSHRCPKKQGQGPCRHTWGAEQSQGKPRVRCI